MPLQELLVAQGVSKVFASMWLDDVIFMGTKDNRLLRFDLNKDAGMQSIRILGSSPSGVQETAQCGIHFISKNHSGTKLVTGGANACDIAVYTLDPSGETSPLGLLVGHSNWVFSAQFVSEQVVVSGCRNGMLGAWKLNALDDCHFHVEDQSLPVLGLAHEYTLPSGGNDDFSRFRIRDVKVFDQRFDFVTVSSDEKLRLWDSKRLCPIVSINVDHGKELVCSAIDQKTNIVSMGSLAHIQFADPRSNKVIASFNSLDEKWGVRALDFHEGLLTIGGGYGRLSYFDFRASKFLPNGEKEFVEIEAAHVYPDSSRYSWIVDEVIGIPTAIYTLAYNQSRTDLFLGGGPTPVRLVILCHVLIYSVWNFRDICQHLYLI
jgi:WD repeat-containing protein 40A